MLWCGKITILLLCSFEEKKNHTLTYIAYLECLKSCSALWLTTHGNEQITQLPSWFQTTTGWFDSFIFPSFFLFFPFLLFSFYLIVSLIHRHSHKIVWIYVILGQNCSPSLTRVYICIELVKQRHCIFNFNLCDVYSLVWNTFQAN